LPEGRLAKVIDHGDISIGDPDYDLAFLAARLGPDFLAGLLRHLPHHDPSRLTEEIGYFIAPYAIDDILIGLGRSVGAEADSAPADVVLQAEEK
jgi:aminoglycoside 2''-phosphotransferase